MARPRRRVMAHLRYLAALLARFRITLVLAGVLFLGAPLAFVWLYVGPDGDTIHYGQALHHVYFLLFGQPSLPYVDNLFLEVLNLAIPPFGIAVVVDGIVRFTYLYFAKHRDDNIPAPADGGDEDRALGCSDYPMRVQAVPQVAYPHRRERAAHLPRSRLRRPADGC